VSLLDWFFYEFLGMKIKNYDVFTINNLNLNMRKANFPEKLTEEILAQFNEMKNKMGEQQFRERFANLHFQIPDPYKNEVIVNEVYDNYGDWIERELVLLEKEINLSWEEQVADIANVNIHVRKTQLVLRHRIS